MLSTNIKFFKFVILFFIAGFVVSSTPVFGADSNKKKEELRRKIAELERKKHALNQQAAKRMQNVGRQKQDLGTVIAQYEKLLSKCSTQKSARCADVMYTLGKLYYDKARDDYVRDQNAYEKAMDKWDRDHVGQEPIPPRPDYTKSLKMYQMATDKYPSYEKADEGYYQIGAVLMASGELEASAKAFEQVVTKFPNSVRASAAHFRLADFCFMNRDFSCALKHLEAINPSQVNLDVLQMAHYRRAEIYYNRANFDKSAELFFSFVEKCDAGEYPKQDLRSEALEYLAISFSDMPNGGAAAVKFFKSRGSRPYEDYVLYTVGMKNYNHGQYDDAILALKTALKSYPYYKDAPVAQQMLVACYVIKKKHELANEEREKLIDYYYKDGEWAKRNAGNAAAIESATNEVKRALSQVPIYYHAMAQKTGKKEYYEKAMARYLEFFAKFPNDKWKVYEFKYNIASIYNTLHQYEKAAECYDYVARQDLSSYPRFEEEIDTLAMDAEQVEKLRKDKNKKTGVGAISQEKAGYNAIVALDNLRKQKIAQASLSDKQALALPETQKFLSYIHSFQKRFPNNPSVPEILYLAGNVYYSAEAYQNAVAEFQLIVDRYSTSPYAPKSMRMLANSYVSTGEYGLALSSYERLLAKEKPGSEEYKEIIELAAGALYKKADALRNGGNLIGATDVFKSIYTKFPNSKVASRGWFEAGLSLEKAGSLELSAITFKEFGSKFPKSELRERAYILAAKNYEKLNKCSEAADVYVLAASKITKADYAIPSLSSASQCFRKVGLFGKSAKVSEMIYKRYPKDKRTPQALYNAGIIYEKGKLYAEAIRVYRVLATNFPESDLASEGYFSIGFCYEKLGKSADMANAFMSYAQKFTTNKAKQVSALVKASEAYAKLGNKVKSEQCANLAIGIVEKYKGKADIDLVDASKAYNTIAENRYADFLAIKLKAKSEKLVRKKVREKTKALEPVLKAYAKVIELGVGDWVIRSSYKIGQSFVDMANAVKNQSLFGTKEQRIASKIKIISMLEKYYIKAQEKFEWNIETAYQQGLTGKWVDKSTDSFMEMAYLKGHLLEEIGEIFKNAPIPKGLSAEDRNAYKDVLEEKYLEALDAALPKYEEGVRAAKALGIVSSPWLDKIKDRIQFINPASEALNIQIVARPPKASIADTSSASSDSGVKKTVVNKVKSDDFLARRLRRINNIMAMNISVTDKISQLKSMERDAIRGIEKEKDRILEVKSMLGKE